MVAAAEWILKKQIRNKGDWSIKNPKTPPGGWYFEFNNEFYPDVDDSAMVMLGLSHVDTPDQRYQSESVKRAIDWVLSMQCKNGGWASFDKDNDRMVFQYVPFADHNAMLDPPTVDITGQGAGVPGQLRLYAERQAGEAGDPVHSRRTGVGWLLVRPLGRELPLRNHVRVCAAWTRSASITTKPMVQQAAEWIRMMQNPDGGWGESCDSYDDPNSERNRPEHLLANRLGRARLDGCRRFPQRFGGQRHSVPARRAEGGRLVV